MNLLNEIIIIFITNIKYYKMIIDYSYFIINKYQKLFT